MNALAFGMRVAGVAVAVAVLSGVELGMSQSFTNLDFEGAHIARGTPPGNIAFSNAFPGWTGYAIPNGGGNPNTNVYLPTFLDAISLGGSGFALVNTNGDGVGGLSDFPIDGRYSAVLFGGYEPSFGLYTAIMSQTGLVPAGTHTLFVDAQPVAAYPYSTFSISLNGQTLNMIPLQTFPTYTVYGADISGFANETATLNLEVPCPPYGSVPPYGVEFDDIVFSSTIIPEPDALALWMLGLGVMGMAARRERVWPQTILRMIA